MTDWSPFLGLPLWAWLFVLPSVLAAVSFVAGQSLRPALVPIWRALDTIYLAAGVLAALFLLAILGLIVAQMVARWTSNAFPGSTEYAGYAMAGASFFALAHALTRGAHIRVSLFLNINNWTKRWLDLLALYIAALTATFFARFAIKTAGFSHMLNDRTQGQDQMPDWLIAWFSLDFSGAGDGWSYTPVWIPQLSMCIGATLLAICLWDMLIRTIIDKRPMFVTEAVE